MGRGRFGRAVGLRLASGVALTLNGLAPGTIADAATALLVRRGFAEAQVDAGEVRLTGARRAPVALPELGVSLRAALVAVAVSRPGALTLPGGSGHILTRDGAAPACGKWSPPSPPPPPRPTRF